MADFIIKAGDTRPSLRAVLTDENGDVVGLADATVVILIGVGDGEDPMVEAAVDILDEGAGLVGFDWEDEELPPFGVYRAEWRIDYDDGRTIRFPNDGYLYVRVTKNLEADST